MSSPAGVAGGTASRDASPRRDEAVEAGAPVPVSTIGAKQMMTSDPALAASFFASAGKLQTLNVTGILGGKHPTLGYAYSTPGVKRGYAVYVENPLPANRRSKLESNS